MATITPQEAHFELAHWNDDRGPLVVITTTIFVAFAMTTVVLRLFTRKAITKISWQVDDYAIIVAMVRLFPNQDELVADSPKRLWPQDSTLRLFSVRVYLNRSKVFRAH